MSKSKVRQTTLKGFVHTHAHEHRMGVGGNGQGQATIGAEILWKHPSNFNLKNKTKQKTAFF